MSTQNLMVPTGHQIIVSLLVHNLKKRGKFRQIFINIFLYLIFLGFNLPVITTCLLLLVLYLVEG